MTLGINLMEEFKQGSPDHERYKEITDIIQGAEAKFQLFKCGQTGGVGFEFEINGTLCRTALRIPKDDIEGLRRYIGERLDANETD